MGVVAEERGESWNVRVPLPPGNAAAIVADNQIRALIERWPIAIAAGRRGTSPLPPENRECPRP